MESLQWFAEDAKAMSELIADAIIKKMQPVKDDLTESQARKAYGVRWLNRMVESGHAEYHWIGSRKIFSRHQLDCLRTAERRRAELVFRKNATAGGG